VQIIRRLIDGNHVRLLSDLHIGSPDVDYVKLRWDILHGGNSHRININGDVMDLILPRDGKRYTPAGALHKRLWGRDDVVNGMVEWAEELLAPVAGRIDMIGDGNHEEAVEKYHSVSPVKLLIERLNNKHGGHIAYGGYNGFFVYTGNSGRRTTVYYHHGAGGGGIGSAATDFQRTLGFVDADVIWTGHRHFRYVTELERVACGRGKEPVYRRTVGVMTGSYLRTYRTGHESYGSRKKLPPQGMGGIDLYLTPRISAHLY
jgi:hypothetical protein